MRCALNSSRGQAYHARRQARPRAAAPTFPPDGLYFVGPYYDAGWGLPTRVPTHDWMD